MDFSVNARMAEYYEKFIELQEKLRKSEEERLKLEMKFNEMVQKSREEEQVYYRRLRSQYKKFLEEDRKRQERNEKIVRTLERIETRIDMLTSKTERFKSLRRHYHNYLHRVSGLQTPKPDSLRYNLFPKETSREVHPPNDRFEDEDQQKINDEKLEILDRYLESISSQKCKDLIEKKKVETAELDKLDALKHRLNTGFDSNKAQSIAEEIMNSIYNRHYNKDPNQNDRYTTSINQKPNIKVSIDDDDKSDTSDLPKVTDEIQYQNLERSNIQQVNRKNDTEDNEKGVFEEDTHELRFTSKPSDIENKLDDSEKEMLQEKLPKYIQDTASTNNEKEFGQQSNQKYSVPKNVSFTTETDDFVEVRKFDNTVNIDEDNQHDIPIINDKQKSLIEDDVEKEHSQHIEDIPKSLQIEDADHTTASDTLSQSEFSVQRELINDQITNFSEEKQQKDHTQKKEPILNSQKEFGENQLPTESLKNIQETDANGQVIQYDQNGQPIQYDGNEQPIQYDTSGSVPYDQHGQPIPYDVNDQPIQYDENVQGFQYDEHGQPIQYDETEQAIQYDGNGQPSQYDKTDQPVEYDQNGQPIQYDQNNQPIQYDEDGQPLQYDQNGQPIHYDEHGQPVQYDQTGQPIQYDENGQPIQYDQNGQAVQYDQNGQVIQYDEHGQPIQYDENGQPIPYDPQSQPIQYDENGQPIYFDQTGQQIQYDENGQIIQYDQNGQPIQYDENGQPVYPFQNYDEHGQPIQQYNESDQLIQYDENGQPIQYDDQQAQNYSAERQEEGAEKLTTESVLPDTSADISQENIADNNQASKNKVLELLDTDTESLQQNVSKVSDSDFSISQ